MQDGRRGKQRNARITDPKARAHKEKVAEIVRKLYRGEPWTGPVVIGLTAVFAIPQSWPKRVRQAAIEGRVWHIADPDLDQLVKQIMDAIKGIVVVDDNQLVGFERCAKRYGTPERTEVRLLFLDQDEDAITPGQRRLEAPEGT